MSRVLEVYLKPMQETMLKVAPIMQLAGREARERARLLPSIMQVHACARACLASVLRLSRCLSSINKTVLLVFIVLIVLCFARYGSTPERDVRGARHSQGKEESPFYCYACLEKLRKRRRMRAAKAGDSGRWAGDS